jgi:hypothetical protein
MKESENRPRQPASDRTTFPAVPLLSRRAVFSRIGGGFGALGLAQVLSEAGINLGSGPVLAAPPSGKEEAVPRDPLAPRPSHFPARAKRVIFLFMNGGPSHVDTFDPKPALERYAGQDPPAAVTTGRRKRGKIMPSPFPARPHGQSGIEMSNLFPNLAGCIDEICVLRAMYTDNPNHEPSLLMMNSGNMQPIRPSLGSWLIFGLGTENQNLPGFVVLCPGKPVVGPQLWSSSFLPGIYQGTHIRNQSIDPDRIIRDVTNRHLSRPEQRSMLDLLQELNREHLQARTQDLALEARIASMEMAFRMQFEAREAFDLANESKFTRQQYGDGEFANACLISRRLVERGVRVVQVYYGADQPWDDHQDISRHRDHAQKSDRPIAALLKDLKARGLLEDTLVIWGGEFGRTPYSEGAKGRDHHSLGFSMWLAGGGVKGGIVHGATDELGMQAVANRMHIHDLHATILHLMGLDHERLTYRYSGRDFRLTDVAGHVALEILA